MTTTVIIRDRYQITLPDSIRKDLNWVKPNQPVKISIDEKNRIVIEPYEGKNIDEEYKKSSE